MYILDVTYPTLQPGQTKSRSQGTDQVNFSNF